MLVEVASCIIIIIIELVVAKILESSAEIPWDIGIFVASLNFFTDFYFIKIDTLTTFDVEFEIIKYFAYNPTYISMK